MHTSGIRHQRQDLIAHMPKPRAGTRMERDDAHKAPLPSTRQPQLYPLSHDRAGGVCCICVSRLSLFLRESTVIKMDHVCVLTSPFLLRRRVRMPASSPPSTLRSSIAIFSTSLASAHTQISTTVSEIGCAAWHRHGLVCREVTRGRTFQGLELGPCNRGQLDDILNVNLRSKHSPHSNENSGRGVHTTL